MKEKNNQIKFESNLGGIKRGKNNKKIKRAKNKKTKKQKKHAIQYCLKCLTKQETSLNDGYSLVTSEVKNKAIN